MELDKMSHDEWKDLYKQSVKHWKDEYRNALKEHKERLRDWKTRVRSSISEGSAPPPLPPLPPLPSMHSLSAVRSNVVASRLGDEELESIDMLIEAHLFSTRSEAVAYFVSEGIKARQDVLDKVSSALEEIRKIRNEAEEHVEKLKEEIGFAERKDIKKTEEQKRYCPECGKNLSDLPNGIAVCPYCGRSFQKTS
jgi:NADH pyrophosphatase NudC (nudix superfamily)